MPASFGRRDRIYGVVEDAMASYSQRVKADIQRWQAAGLIDGATASALEADIVSHVRKGISLGAIVAMLAAALFAAAILLVIAANWAFIDRPVRVAMVFALILAGYVGGAILKLRNHSGFAEAAWFVSAAAFGGGIALIGQMYHMSGDEVQAILVWCAGTALASAMLRSATLTTAAVLLLFAWLGGTLSDMSSDAPFPYIFLLYAALMWGLSMWTGARPARQLLVLSLIGYALLFFLYTEDLAVLVGLAIVSAGVMAASVLVQPVVERLTGIAWSLQVLGFLGFLVAMFALQFSDPSIGMFILQALIIFGGIVGAVLLAARENRPLRWLAYAGFAVELGYIYARLLGSMLGTAGFFMATAAILALLAYVIIRIERRLARPALAGAA